ncbi:hypothetical protein QBC32DRAFT_342358 [Pseudoneurospora amorphoporcata]|uniref:Secreted protein n=1 Tax=Pseudoneurospora amorphoporcata TaxID=241081 RepID=A0AAN6NU50_9PEZI|nr:hypothetical protein QBC32DRAFT_342358 [Pseudoneurospora amorphoporcata]
MVQVSSLFSLCYLLSLSREDRTEKPPTSPAGTTETTRKLERHTDIVASQRIVGWFGPLINFPFETWQGSQAGQGRKL